ncbi:hypothetical protein GLOTRDRAFT_97754 [Gloeophyllum trabeum ATCC 11539]|uniref:Uncharacterized protein n=1 Tax=Gloeophyllum trabeum (strain ATCC 11539 / FP-39264 / Madison 617) TaxID=670483 RepID=S7QMI6_GLOTA|nr:uncharacterized protein GLOTRDRAFT_97754 [Gloeophyllum trabeum ATCC 11539]EPQ60663.1 hypothetical protein GLOTRDRAFT_97754 [Gloeophyllum trabeum ATCC 11539]
MDHLYIMAGSVWSTLYHNSMVITERTLILRCRRGKQSFTAVLDCPELRKDESVIHASLLIEIVTMESVRPAPPLVSPAHEHGTHQGRAWWRFEWIFRDGGR